MSSFLTLNKMYFSPIVNTLSAIMNGLCFDIWDDSEENS
jgi:hypothetical protein